ncbi:unnamed protein product, partial [Ectocarpus fasciculatus]
MSGLVRPRGAFILFEGIDRCGKSTQCALLAESLAKTAATELIRFPDRTSCIGGLINSYLASSTNMNDQTIHLLFSANRWEASQALESKLRAGTTLICDRYAYSGVAFSAAKGLDMEWCKSCDDGLIAPDCIIYLDMTVENAAKRGNYGEERYEKEEFQRAVRSQFLELKQRDTVPWFVIDATQTKEAIHDSISAIAAEVTSKLTAESPLSRLWGG